MVIALYHARSFPRPLYLLSARTAGAFNLLAECKRSGSSGESEHRAWPWRYLPILVRNARRYFQRERRNSAAEDDLIARSCSQEIRMGHKITPAGKLT